MPSSLVETKWQTCFSEPKAAFPRVYLLPQSEIYHDCHACLLHTFASTKSTAVAVCWDTPPHVSLLCVLNSKVLPAIRWNRKKNCTRAVDAMDDSCPHHAYASYVSKYLLIITAITFASRDTSVRNILYSGAQRASLAKTIRDYIPILMTFLTIRGSDGHQENERPTS